MHIVVHLDQSPTKEHLDLLVNKNYYFFVQHLRKFLDISYIQQNLEKLLKKDLTSVKVVQN